MKSGRAVVNKFKFDLDVPNSDQDSLGENWHQVPQTKTMKNETRSY